MFLRHFSDVKAGIPYGIALGLGGLLTFPDSPLMIWALDRLAVQLSTVDGRSSLRWEAGARPSAKECTVFY